mmetsp:Transcript_27951/g.69429  ORF Transcript_27951/g.69429 Transcript_27951/m.69429 type:complete len:479 (+) Transcript_27951:44-1480(+)
MDGCLQAMRGLAAEMEGVRTLQIPFSRHQALHDACDEVEAVLDSRYLRCGDCNERMSATDVLSHVCEGRFCRVQCGDCGQLVEGDRVSDHVCVRCSLSTATPEAPSEAVAPCRSDLSGHKRQTKGPFTLEGVHQRLVLLCLELSQAMPSSPMDEASAAWDPLHAPTPWWELFTPDACEQLLHAIGRVRAVLDERFLKCGDCRQLIAAEDIAHHSCRPASGVKGQCTAGWFPKKAEAFAECLEADLTLCDAPDDLCLKSSSRLYEIGGDIDAEDLAFWNLPFGGDESLGVWAKTPAKRMRGDASSEATAKLSDAPSEASGGASDAGEPPPRGGGDAKLCQPRRRAWSVREDEAICELVAAHGQDFGAIAARLPGRTADAVRNRWGRLKGGGKLPAALKGLSYNCASCGEPKRGHRCKAAGGDSRPVRMRRGEAPTVELADVAGDYASHEEGNEREKAALIDLHQLVELVWEGEVEDGPC